METISVDSIDQAPGVGDQVEHDDKVWTVAGRVWRLDGTIDVVLHFLRDL